jgi:hypothetical protein
MCPKIMLSEETKEGEKEVKNDKECETHHIWVGTRHNEMH